MQVRTDNETVSTAQKALLVRGSIVAVATNGYRVNGGSGVGDVWVYTNASTKLGGNRPLVGSYAVAVGTGSYSTSLTALYSAVSGTTAPTTTFTADVTSSQPYGYAIRLTNGTYAPLALSSGTQVSGTIALWKPVTVEAVGTPADGYAALKLTGSTSTTTTTTSSTATSTGIPPMVRGSIVSVGTGSFVVNGGTGVGDVTVTHNSSTRSVGYAPRAGYYAVASGTQGSTSLAATYVAVYSTTAPTSTFTADATAKEPYGYAIKLASGDYVSLAVNSATQMSGSIAYWKPISIEGVGTATTGFAALKITAGTTSTTPSTSTTSTTTSTTSSASSATSWRHVLTAGILYTYSGTPATVPVTSVAPYLSWAQTDEAHAALLRAERIKVDVYFNFWRNYTTDNPDEGYLDLRPGGAHAAAEAKTCSGTVIRDPTYGGGYEADALRTSYAEEHAAVVADYREREYAGNYDAVFSDDTGALGGLPLPCGYTVSAYKSATNAVDHYLAKPMFVNTLNAGSSTTGQVGYAAASNVIGAMCESCYAYWTTVSGVKRDFPRYASKWADEENAEALMVREHKIFWAYSRAIGSAAYETKLRMYVYASFLLTYSPSYAMLQEVFQTPSGFEVFPESGLVPLDPVTTSSTVAGYEHSGGIYMREFDACYYRGALRGKCAVVVNPGLSSAVVPATAFKHQMVLSGYGVLDRGSVSFSGTRPSSLPAESAAILFP